MRICCVNIRRKSLIKTSTFDAILCHCAICVQIKPKASLTWPCLLPYALFPVIHSITTALLLTQQHIQGHVSATLSQTSLVFQ